MNEEELFSMRLESGAILDDSSSDRLNFAYVIVKVKLKNSSLCGILYLPDSQLRLLKRLRMNPMFDI
jgi:hypothetical protein